MPQGAVGQDSVQGTPRFAGSLTTVAASCVVALGSMVPKSAGALTVIGPCGLPVTALPPSPPHAERAAAANSDKRSAARRWVAVFGGFMALLSLTVILGHLLRRNPDSGSRGEAGRGKANPPASIYTTLIDG